jgi:hypothetical protein
MLARTKTSKRNHKTSMGSTASFGATAAFDTSTATRTMGFQLNETILQQIESPGLINIFRFDTFAKVDAFKLKLALSKFPYCILNGNEQKLCEIINNKNFEHFKLFVSDHAIEPSLPTESFVKSLSKKMPQLETKAINKNIDEIMNLYFKYTDPAEAQNLLSHLFEVTFETQEQYDTYFKNFKELDKRQQVEYRGYRC